MTSLNNPRKANGDFGDECCGVCGCYSSAYVEFDINNNKIIMCKSCLLNCVDIINKTTLKDVMIKDKLLHKNKKGD
jgi:hypothetical protein